MGNSASDKKTNLVKLVNYQLTQGFTFLEILICIIGLQLVYVFIVPNVETYIQAKHCKLTVHEFEHFITDAKLRAILLNRSLNLMRDAKRQWILIDSKRKTINAYFPTKDMIINWNGFSKKILSFESELLANHLNGYFDIICAGKFKYRLWLNRLGHTRIEIL